MPHSFFSLSGTSIFFYLHIQVALGVVGAHDAVVVGLRDVTSMANPELLILNLKTGVVEGTPATAYIYFLYILYSNSIIYFTSSIIYKVCC